MMKLVSKLYRGGNSLRGTETKGFTRHLGNTISISLNKKTSYLHCVENQALLGATLGQLIDIAPDRFGDRLAVIDSAQEIRKTYTQYVKDIDKLGTGLLALNLQRGDRIGIWCPNRYEWTLVQMAAAKAGLILVTLNPAYQPQEFEYCLSKLGVRALVAPESFKTQAYYEMITAVVPEVVDSKPGQTKSKKFPKFDTLITLSDKDFPGALKFKDVMNAGGSQEKQLLDKLQNEIQFDDAANIQFTSGTTGKPKAATLTYFAMNNNAIAVSRRMGFFNTPQRILSNVPLFHCFGCVGVNITALVCGGCAVYPAPGFSPEDSLKSIEKEKCTSVFGTPTMFYEILNHPNFPKTNVSSVKSGVMAGAPCPPELLKEVVEKMDCPEFITGYGSTELSPLLSCHHSTEDGIEKKLETVGRILPNTEVKIVDANNRIVPLRSPGEICARGYQVMKGFWDDEEKTKEVIENGWYHTGDIGSLTEDGYLRVVGRIKDMVIRGGENIYPKEIEDILITHPKIGEAYVFGVPDKRMGEEVCVWIKLKDKEIINENDVIGFCKGKLSHYKIPRYVRFVKAFPQTATGKVQKYVMQEEMIKLLESQ